MTQIALNKMQCAPLNLHSLTPYGGADPGPLKCFCAPSHQILAISAPQKARNRDNAEFATKLRKLSQTVLN